jgi:beta-aspartyl-dipeptidase (metallo-type)
MSEQQEQQEQKSSVTFTLIEHGEVYAPEPMGVQSVLLMNDRIVKVGAVDITALLLMDVPFEVIEAEGLVVTPGLIDPHEHLAGAGGEHGFASRLPEVTLEELVKAGITTVVGLLGTDTTSRTLQCLHAKANQLRDEGLTTFIYGGGFELPPQVMTDRVMDDLVNIDTLIGTGEIAISDTRFVDPELRQLAQVVTETMTGGRMAGKAGVTHFHLGDQSQRLDLLRQLMDVHGVPPQVLYPTHITKTPELLKEAVDLANRGCFVDMDTIEENIADCVQQYRKLGGPMDKLTLSSDAHTPEGLPGKLHGQLVSCVRDYGMPLEEILPLCTSNTADVLKLKGKGHLQAGLDADVLVMTKGDMDIMHLFARGQRFIRDAQLAKRSEQLQALAAS